MGPEDEDAEPFAKCYALLNSRQSGFSRRAAAPFKRTGESLRAVPTETPPPYFPQTSLSPGDEKTARKMRLAFYGCGLLLLLALVGAILGVVYLVRSLS